MQFVNATDHTGLIQHGYTHGCAVGDYDNDGFDDLYVTAYGGNAMWRNNGDGTFANVTQATETAVMKWSSSAAFADLNSDGFLDLYVVNYLDESDESPKVCPNPASPDGRQQCPPAMYDGVDDVLFLSDGAGVFLDATETAGLKNLRGKGLGVVICDLDRNGACEIFVANDGQANFLLVPTTEATVSTRDGLVLKTSRYEDRALLSSVALSEAGYAQANMGVAAGDYDASGTTDLLITHFYADTTTLYSNLGNLRFEDATRSSRVGPPSRTRLGWGTSFIDADNNGWLDLIVANGHVDDKSWMNQGEPYKMRPQFFRNSKGGYFDDVSDWAGPYFQQNWLGRGLATGDLDRDGRLDVVISHQLGPSCALQNQTLVDNSSLVVRLVGTSGNRNAYGSRIELLHTDFAVARDLCGGGSFQSASVPEFHIGLGSESHGSIRVHWPSGIQEVHNRLTPGCWLIVEGNHAVPISLNSSR
jgi:hypothetical protein